MSRVKEKPIIRRLAPVVTWADWEVRPDHVYYMLKRWNPRKRVGRYRWRRDLDPLGKPLRNLLWPHKQISEAVRKIKEEQHRQ